MSAITSDPSGAVWVGTYGGGLYRVDQEVTTFTAYRHDPGDPRSLSDDTVMDLLAARDGAIWVGTRSGGLNRLDADTGTFTHFAHNPADPRSIGGDIVLTLAERANGDIWAGTIGGGLDRLDPASGVATHFRHDPADPTTLGDDSVYGLLMDRAGVLWVGSPGGGLDSLRVDPDKPGRFIIRHYRHRARAVAAGSRPSDVPHLRIRGRAPDCPTDARDAREFAALDFRRPGLNRYRYMLDGFDRQWTDVDSTHRLVTYTNLDPGTYVLRVTGSNGSRVWNPTERTLTLIVRPPWWASWWFRSLLVVLLIGGAGAVYLWRIRTLQVQRPQLEILVAQRSKELHAALQKGEAALATRDVFLRTLAHDLMTVRRERGSGYTSRGRAARCP